MGLEGINKQEYLLSDIESKKAQKLSETIKSVYASMENSDEAYEIIGELDKLKVDFDTNYKNEMGCNFSDLYLMRLIQARGDENFIDRGYTGFDFDGKIEGFIKGMKKKKNEVEKVM